MIRCILSLSLTLIRYSIEPLPCIIRFLTYYQIDYKRAPIIGNYYDENKKSINNKIINFADNSIIKTLPTHNYTIQNNDDKEEKTNEQQDHIKQDHIDKVNQLPPLKKKISPNYHL